MPFKWVIYRVDPTKDIAATKTYIHVNDFMVLADGRIAVVGQREDTTQAAGPANGNLYSYSIWHYTPDTAFAEVDIPLNATYRQYHFDPNGYLEAVDAAGNTPFFVDPQGNRIAIDLAALKDSIILSPVYSRLKEQYAVMKRLASVETSTLLRYDAGRKMFLSTGITAQSIFHLASGNFLLGDDKGYSVYDPEIGHPTGKYPKYQLIGDSVLLIDARNQYFFINNLLNPVPVCSDPEKNIQAVAYFRGPDPSLVVRYDDTTLSLYTFKTCGSDAPEEVEFAGKGDLIPLLGEKDAVYYLTKDGPNSNHISIYRIEVQSGQLADDPTRKSTFFTGDGLSDLVVTPLNRARPGRFLLVYRNAGLSSATLLDISSSGGIVFTPIEKSAKVIQYFPGSRFLSGLHDEIWTTHDLVFDGAEVKPDQIKDVGKVTMVEKFYRVKCPPDPDRFYYNYMVGTNLRTGTYKKELPRKALAKKKVTLKAKPVSTNRNAPKNGK